MTTSPKPMSTSEVERARRLMDGDGDDYPIPVSADPNKLKEEHLYQARTWLATVDAQRKTIKAQASVIAEKEAGMRALWRRLSDALEALRKIGIDPSEPGMDAWGTDDGEDLTDLVLSAFGRHEP